MSYLLPMSENITHTAICDDVIRLSRSLDELPAFFHEILDRHRDAARMGAITRSADKWSADLIDWSREELKKPEDARDPQLAPKLVFVLGALTHRSADRLMKPTIRYNGDDPATRREATIHMDVFILREVFGHGEGTPAGPYPKDLLKEPADARLRLFEEHFRVLFQRTLIAMHTFAPDTANVHEWLNRFLATLQDFPISVRQYASVAAEWDLEKVRKYLEEPRFYDRNEPIIQTARALQHGETVDSTRVKQAISDTGEHSSRYAWALRKAIDYFRAAGELFNGRITKDQALPRLDIGVPELSLTIGKPAH